MPPGDRQDPSCAGGPAGVRMLFGVVGGREMPQFAGERMPGTEPASQVLPHEKAVAEDAVGGVQDRERGPACEIGIGEVRADEALGALVSLHRE